uniref:Elongation factor Ts, mitochondrial n=1 Tax=Alona affinis TaxID=381656 RepID=A0A9N6ZF10_9CRUS|nr:EOG090X0EI4 [Alona affinis]
MIFRRLFHTSVFLPFYSAPKVLSSQSLLATLRKKTGYSISNCKKALQVNNDDLSQAEKWLNSQAQSQGWDKAVKLQSRATLNGLVGIAFDHKKAVIVEVNCETDFVGKNEKFQSLVAHVAETCLSHVPVGDSGSILQVGFSSEQLGALKNAEGKPLADVLALNIGQIGENMSLRRAAAFSVSDADLKLACCTHPLSTKEQIFLGKYGAVVVYTEASNPPADSEASPTEFPEGITLEKLSRQLCQHVIGMNPRSIEKIVEEPNEEEKTKPIETAPPTAEEGDPKSEEKPRAENDDTALLEQDFVANPEYRVGEILDLVGWKVKGFVRLECGESQE